MSTKIIDKEKRREELLKVAINVFAKNGYVNTTMDSIAKASNVSKGLLYEYFSGKEELLVELLGYFEKLFKSKTAERLNLVEDPKEKIKILIEYSFEIYAEMSDFINIMFIFWVEAMINIPKNRLNLVYFYDDFRDYIAEIISEGIKKGCFKEVDTYSSASVILAAMDGLCLQLILDIENFPIKNASEELSRTILKRLEA